MLADVYNEAMWSLLLGLAHITATVTLITKVSSDVVPFLLKVFLCLINLESSLGIVVGFGFSGNCHQTSNAALLKLRRKATKLQVVGFNKKERAYRTRFLGSC